MLAQKVFTGTSRSNLRTGRSPRMRLHSSGIRESICRLLVPALILWLGGAGSLNCCAKNTQAASANNQTRTVEPPAMPMQERAGTAYCSGHHCQDANRRGDVVLSVSSCGMHSQASGPPGCCSFAGQATDPARKYCIATERAISQTANSRRPALDSISYIERRAYRLTLLNCSETYLRHCALLI